MCVVVLKVCCALVLLKLSAQLPCCVEAGVLQRRPLYDFEDDWDYEPEPHNTPMLKPSKHRFLLPYYSFNEDLNVRGLNQSTSTSPKKLPIYKNIKIAGDILKSTISCPVCILGVGLLYREVKAGKSFDEIKQKFVALCVTFQIAIASVCNGVFDTYGPEVIPVLEIVEIGPSDICKLMFGEICEAPDVLTHEWTVDIPPVSKASTTDSPLPKTGNPVFKVLQISDTHYDLDYIEGSTANCQEPLCCRAYSTLKAGEKKNFAGKWGSYENCDAPKVLLENMLQHIALQHPDIAYIIWNGDLVPHDIWNQTRSSNLKIIKETIEMISKTFPNTSVFPAIGNHESVPAGNFAPPWMTNEKHSISWLYDEIFQSWSKWLPDDSKYTLHRGGFYSVLLRPGFRLISVNTNYCHSLSWWLLVNNTDPASELKWLIHELQEAENKEEKVHIIGHIAPGSSDCMKTWSKHFYDIVNRYEHTIMALFYGHSHADEFEIFYDNSENGRPTAVAYLAPSVTSYTNYNPAYRIYYIDGDHPTTTREVLDHETWTFDLDRANQNNNEPYWYKLYSAKNTYFMNSLRPIEWNKLIDDMTNNEELFDIFHANYYRHSKKRPTCDTKCRIEIICDLKCAKSHSRHQLCQQLETAFETK